MLPVHEYGKYGGRCLRPFNADVPYIVDAEISADAASKWPIGNRKALFELGKVEWYGPPEDAEKRTVAAKAAVAKEPKIVKEVKSKTPVVKKSHRTK